jgi:hypothetical protein
MKKIQKFGCSTKPIKDVWKWAQNWVHDHYVTIMCFVLKMTYLEPLLFVIEVKDVMQLRV